MVTETFVARSYWHMLPEYDRPVWEASLNVADIPLLLQVVGKDMVGAVGCYENLLARAVETPTLKSQQSSTDVGDLRLARAA